MLSFIYMKILESRPSRYDAGIRWLSLGAADRTRREIAGRAIRPGDRVLDIGTGTGALALLATEKGAEVVGMDVSASMLSVAEAKRKQHNAGDRVTLIEAGVAEMDAALAGMTFDVATACLVFSELSQDEQRYALRQVRERLRPGGLLVVADETRPPGLLKRVLYGLIRLPLAILTLLLTQTGTRPVQGLEAKVVEAGFNVERTDRRNLDSFLVLYARKEDDA